MSDVAAALTSGYRGRQVLITGGLGFIGSNLAVALARQGARVRVLDSLQPGCGGSLVNLAGYRSDIDVEIADIRDEARASSALRGVDVVFNLAGEVSHAGSMRDPLRDLELNVVAQLAFLQVCARVRPGVRVVYTSTRQVYGRTGGRPVDESHPVAPVDFNGVHKYATTHYHLLLGRLGAIDPIGLRLTNVYGPRMALHADGHGVLAVFFRQALAGERLAVFGDGRQRRDPLFVDDVLRALMASGLVRDPAHRLINIGHRTGSSLLQIARSISRLAGLPEPILQPWPEAHKAVDIGDYCTSAERAREVLGWSARVSLEAGLRKTWEFYCTPEADAGFMGGPSSAIPTMSHG